MALLSYQTAASLGTLYEVKAKGGVSGSEQLNANIYLDSGKIDVYVSNSATEPSSLSDMALNDAGIENLRTFSAIPRYMAFVQHSGTTTEIVLSGIEAQSLGAIS